MKIVFMGTPDFALPSLQALHRSAHEVVGVVTVADKPSGRGRKLRPSPVKQFALDHDLPLLQPEKLRNPAFLEALAAWQADLFVVVAFRMLPKLVWAMPRVGTINLHASLLPDYRGAAPINWVLIRGERQTGLTTFLIDQQIDTGNLLLQETVDIPPNWTAGELHDHMMQRGAELVLRTANGLEAGTLTPRPQDDSLFIHKAPKIFPEDCQIDWDQPAEVVHNFIRGLSPFPAARTQLDGKGLKVYRSRRSDLPADQTPGGLLVPDDRQTLAVACTDHYLYIDELQLAGKKRMPTQAFLLGYKDKLERLES